MVRPDTTTASARVLPLVAEEGNHRLLVEWLDDHETFRLVEPGESLSTLSFDVVVLDEGGLKHNFDDLEHLKEEAAPVLVPYLLLVPEPGMDLIEQEGGQLVENVLTRQIDEIVSLPIKQAELQWRLESLLRLREQSLQARQREQELRRTRRAVEASGYAIYITDTDGTIEYVNPAFEGITGYAKEEVLDKNPQILNSGDMPNDFYDELWETIRSGEVWEEELVNRRKDGDLYHAHQTIAPIEGDDGSVEGFVAIQADITEQVEATQELETFKEIVQRLDAPIMLQDEDGKFQVLNEAVAEYAQMPVEELEGRDEFAFMDEPTATEIARQKNQVLEEERPLTYEVKPSFPTKGNRTFKTTRYPHYDEAGELDGTVALCGDVTDLVEGKRQLAVIDRLLRHNLRSELTIIQGYAGDIIENPRADNGESARMIRAAGTSLRDLAEKERKSVEVLTESGSTRPIELRPMLARIIADVTDAYPDSEVIVECPDGLWVRALGEFEEALYEVIENAVKHDDDKRPEVAVTAAEADASVRISVADNGPGIPETERRVIEGETQIEPLTHGSGLGLWFANLVVSQSGGTLGFRANEPSGSIIEFTVPSADRSAGGGRP